MSAHFLIPTQVRTLTTRLHEQKNKLRTGREGEQGNFVQWHVERDINVGPPLSGVQQRQLLLQWCRLARPRPLKPKRPNPNLCERCRSHGAPHLSLCRLFARSLATTRHHHAHPNLARAKRQQQQGRRRRRRFRLPFPSHCPPGWRSASTTSRSASPRRSPPIAAAAAAAAAAGSSPSPPWRPPSPPSKPPGLGPRSSWPFLFSQFCVPLPFLPLMDKIDRLVARIGWMDGWMNRFLRLAATRAPNGSSWIDSSAWLTAPCSAASARNVGSGIQDLVLVAPCPYLVPFLLWGTGARVGVVRFVLVRAELGLGLPGSTWATPLAASADQRRQGRSSAIKNSEWVVRFLCCAAGPGPEPGRSLSAESPSRRHQA